jgi:predicted kinase
MRQLAEKLRARLLILDFQIAAQDLERRIRQRSLQAGQISEATLDVLHFQQSRSEPLDREELKSSIPITSDMSVAEIAKRIAWWLRKQETAEDSGPD